MYTQVVADLYTEELAGGQLLLPVGTRFIFTNLAFPKERGAVWFLLWWLFLHRRLRSRQRGLKLAPQATCYFKADHFLKARLRFYPRRPKKALRLFSKLSLSASAWA